MPYWFIVIGVFY